VRILLVDDNKDDRALILRGLRGRWPAVEAVEIADADALTVALATRPDVVITDYQLRFSDGLALLRSVKDLWPDVPVIMYTGTGSEQIAVEAMKSGLDDYVLKTPGQIPRLVGAVSLALEAARQRRAASDAEGRYRNLYEGVPVGLFRATPEGALLDCNPAMLRITGFPDRETLLATNMSFFYPEPAERSALMDRLGRDGVIEHEGWRRRRDGSLIWTRFRAQAVREDDGPMIYYEGVVEDVTDHKQAAEALEAAETRLLQSAKLEAVGRLAGGVAHDFNNLLGVIMGYADLVLKRLPADEPMRRNLQEIQKAAERASALTKQLLAFSRRQILQPRVLDLNHAIYDVESMLQRVIGEDISLVTVLREDVGKVKADPGQVQQVLMNLAVNARDAMPEGGRLTIETANVEVEESYARQRLGVTSGPYVMMAVSDTGCGMTEEVQAHIFEPFFTTKGPEKGTGLGLATVYGIVKQSGGNIWVYSEPAKGTTFKVYLPRVEDPGPRAGPPPVKAPAGGTETVLLVEDDEKVREVIALALKDAGYTVLEARSGEDALLLAERGEPIELVITDLVMPGMSGREMADRWRARHPETRTLFMSGYTDATFQQQAGLPAGVAFIQKPFAPSALARKVREVLRRPSSP
jgi:two-component system cell cycle sensor histidine kinase/response regulator CckA